MVLIAAKVLEASDSTGLVAGVEVAEELVGAAGVAPPPADFCN